jgi:putative oxidoreductase
MKPDIPSMSPVKKRLLFFFRLVIGGLFLYAGVSKIAHPYEFAAAIQAYQLLPQFFVGVAAVLVPWLETVSGLALLCGYKPRSALISLMLLLIFFLAIIVLTMSRGLDIDCGCGLWASRRIGWSAITEDFVLLLVIFGLYFMLLPPSPELSQNAE